MLLSNAALLQCYTQLYLLHTWAVQSTSVYGTHSLVLVALCAEKLLFKATLVVVLGREKCVFYRLPAFGFPANARTLTQKAVLLRLWG